MDTNTQTTEKTEKTLFTLPDHGKENVPIRDLHFYGWMKSKGEKNPHKIDTLKAYLNEIGFDKAVHTLGATWEQDMTILNNQMDMYYQWEILAKGNPPTI